MKSTDLKYSEQDNDWAKDLKDNPIHISLAESGAKGYFCMGCDKEMQAVKRKIAHYKSYFRHHIKDVDNSKIECVHASRTYREKLAFNYFLRTKQITVPAVYKYPPRGVEGDAMLLEEKQIIIAHKVEPEVAFFEDEEGVLHWDKNSNIEERFLWIRPDVVFFDINNKPILFIEFIVTHKPDTEKLNKLQRLGINTVQIIVPKKSEQEIEKAISKASNVKWTYNEIESNTTYISIPKGNSEGIPSIDEDQRLLFEESFKCRAAQIGNLSRRIRRCLESQQYRRTKQLFEQEIQRIEKATREYQSRLEEIRRGIESKLHSELGYRRVEIDNRKWSFQSEYSDLEAGYIAKRELLKEEQEVIDREINFRIENGTTQEGIREYFNRKGREIEFDELHLTTRIQIIRDKIESIERNIED